MRNIPMFNFFIKGFEDISEEDKEDYTIKKTDSILVGAKL